MADSHLYIKGQKYWLYDTYPTKQQAYDIARWGKLQGSKYVVFAVDSWYGSYKVYRVYFNKIRPIWS